MMKKVLTMITAGLLWVAQLNAITPVEQWEEQDVVVATVKVPDMLRMDKSYPQSVSYLPGSDSAERPYLKHTSLLSHKDDIGRVGVIISIYKADDGKPLDIQDVVRRQDFMMKTITSGKSKITWTSISKDELRGFAIFDDAYVEAGVMKYKPRNMMCHILRKGDYLYSVDARFDVDMPEKLTLDEKNKIVKGISGSIKPKH